MKYRANGHLSLTADRREIVFRNDSRAGYDFARAGDVFTPSQLEGYEYAPELFAEVGAPASHRSVLQAPATQAETEAPEQPPVLPLSDPQDTDDSEGVAP